MKILIGTDTPELKGQIAKRFGHANFYLILDSGNNLFEVVDNQGHDEQHQILFDVLNKGVELFIVGNIGPHAFKILNKEGIKIYLARKMSANEAIEKLKRDELPLLSEPTVKKSMHKH